jgi:hypothetical protein
MWDGAVASIVPNKKDRVYGMIVKLGVAELKRLDKYEGVGYKGWYYRAPVTVHNAHTGEAYESIAYIIEDTEMTYPPSVKYLSSIESNLKLSGLKKSQVGTGITVHGFLDGEFKKIGKWMYGTNGIKYVSKKIEKALASKAYS